MSTKFDLGINSRGLRRSRKAAARAAFGAYALMLGLLLGLLPGCANDSERLGMAQQRVTGIAFVQVNSAVPQTSESTVVVPFQNAQSVGNLNVVIVGWNNDTSTVTSVTDTRGNAYQLAVGPTRRTGFGSQSIYYAKNIVAAAAGANSVSVVFDTATPAVDLRILEYAGIDPVNPLDVTAAATGNNTACSSGAVTTTNANDLVVGANTVLTVTQSAGVGFSSRVITNPDGDIAEDRVLTVAGSTSATATLASAGDWVMQMVAFRAAPSGPDTQAPSAPGNLVATAASSAQVNLSWLAATDNVGIANYLIESCAGAGCTNFAQLATVTGTSFSHSGLPAGSSLSYRVRASDAAGNLGSFSNVASAATPVPDTQAPTAPANLSATAISGTQINLSWGAATDNVGVTSYLVESCAGTGCVNFSQLTTTSVTSFSHTGLPAGASFSYRVRARDAAGNLGNFSSIASAATPVPDTQAPTAPANLSATAISGTQINLSWGAATDNVGVTSYLVESCAGTGCVNFSQLTTTSVTSFSHTGLPAGASFSYRVRASDAAGNLGSSSNVASATTTPAPDTQAPTAPANLSATAISGTQINLSWGAATDNVGVTSYLVESCAGTGCVNFSQLTTTSVTSFSHTGLPAGGSFSYRVRASDAAGNLSGASNVASATTAVPDTQAPTTPANLIAAVVSASQINLTWSAASDNVGVTAYLVERCQGAGCTNFVQTTTTTNTSSSDTTLLAGTSYSFRVRAMDAAGNLGSGAVASGTTQSAPANPTFAQGTYADPQTPSSVVAVRFVSAQGAGNLNVVAVGWNDTTARVTSVSDTLGNVYALAVGPTALAGLGTQSLYYAKNIAASTANGNTVSVTFDSPAAFPDVRIAEYRGIDPVNALDVVATGLGTSANSATGAVATTNGVDLLLAANLVSTMTSGAGPGFTSRLLTVPDGDILEDRVVSVAGSYSATAPLQTGAWVMQMAAFRAAGSGPPPPDTTPPSAPSGLVASAASTTQIDLSWNAASDNVAVSGYLVERCVGPGCSNFVQVASTSALSLSSNGLSVGTNYSFRVRASDAAGNLGAYSNVASVTTPAPDTSPPSAPSNLALAVVSGAQIDLSWTFATDNVAVTNYLVERCAGAGCSNFSQIATTTGLGLRSTGLALGQSYSFRVRASDAAGNLGPYSNSASATTPAPDTAPPSAPSSLSAVAVSGTQVALNWSAASDNVGVTGYLLERCLGVGCTTFAPLATATSLAFTDSQLTAGSTANYRVRATDAAGNLSDYSNSSSATTTAPDQLAPTSPPNLTATLGSSAQIDLNWGVATDNVGVTAYLIERCQGLGCTAFQQTTTTTTTTSSDTSLSAGTSYSYRVRATDAAGNLSAYSNVASATTAGVPANPSYVQGNYSDPQAPTAVVTVPYTLPQSAANLNVVAVGWNDTTARVTSVTDTKGNVYVLAVGPTVVPGIGSHAIYYAKGIAAAAAAGNTVSVAFSPAAAFPDVRIAEYRGLDAVNPLDVVATGQGSGEVSATSAVLTTSTVDLLVGASLVLTTTSNPGAGFTSRIVTVPDSDLLEDRVVTTAAAYSATAAIQNGGWIMQMVAFRAGAPAAPDTTPAVAAIVAPTAGATLSGAINVTVMADDPESGVQSVQLLVDGTAFGAPSVAAPYVFSFDTNAFGNGAHSLAASVVNGAQITSSAAAVTVNFSNIDSADPAVVGQWSGTVPMPIVSVHQTLLSTGKILMSDGQIWGPDARIWDYTANTYTAVPAPANIFCGGHEQMPDGRILVLGGHITAHVGLTAANIFNPNTLSWTVAPDMSNPRWYPTVTGLPDGRQLVTSGESACDECVVPVQEIYSPTTNTWTKLTAAPFSFSYYPHVFVLSDGRVIVTSTTEDPTVSQVLDMNALTWTAVGGPAVDGGSSAMYLPNKFLKTGTSCNPDDPERATFPTAYVLDMTASSPTWRQIASMQYPRTFHVETLLPDGNVLVTGGGPTTAATDTARGILPAELWSPASEAWTTMAAMHAPRLYHATALLLPDGRVVVGGGGRFDPVTLPTDQFSAEFYSPPYLFKGPRPVIGSAPAVLQYGQGFTVQTPDAARIASVSLIRYGSTTHQINMAQRYLPLSFTAGSNALTVTAPINSNLAPPGFYMLFIVDTLGVPSVAATVHF